MNTESSVAHLAARLRLTRTLAVAILITFVSSLFPLGASADISSWQRGMSIYPTSPTDFGGSNFDTEVSHLKSLGFNYITLIIPYYQSNIHSSDIAPAGNAPTDQSLISAIQYIHSQGMGVTLKIHLDSGDGIWRAFINPYDRSSWFSAYQNVLTHYASIAEQQGVEDYCIGTELIGVTSQYQNSDNTAEWQKMIGAVRSFYSGKVFYDANWGGNDYGNEPPQIGFWGSLDYIGISAYYNLGGDGSVQSLESDWDSINNSIIRPLSQQYGKQILFSEIGYESISGAHNQPWNSAMGGSYDPQEQVNDYTALFQYWNNYPYFAGVGMWYEFTNQGAGGPGNTDYVIHNKPVEQTIQQFFGNAGSSNVGSTGSGTGSTGGTTSGNGSTNSNPAAFTLSGSASPSSLQSGQATTLSLSATDTGGATTANVDLEVYNSSGTQVFQKTFPSQSFSAGGSQQFSASWAPSSNDTYTVKAGVFSSDWSTLYDWNNSVATISVGTASTNSGGSSGTTNAGPEVTDIWWPTDGANVSGVQPFKAMLENTPLSQYSMYWQVDNGQLNQMSDSEQDYPHKEALVDLSPWNWNGSGPYTVNFVSKDGSGNTISQKAVQIYVSH